MRKEKKDGRFTYAMITFIKCLQDKFDSYQLHRTSLCYLNTLSTLSCRSFIHTNGLEKNVFALPYAVFILVLLCTALL